MLLTGVQIALKPPLCIDSRFVYKIDSLESESSETIYSCRQFRLIPFSDFFYRNIPEIERQLREAESALLLLKIKKYKTVSLTLSPAELQKEQLGSQLLKTELIAQVGDFDLDYVNIVSNFLLSVRPESGGSFVGEAWASAFERQSLLDRLRILESVREKAAQPVVGLNTVDRLKWLGSGYSQFLTEFEKNLKVRFDVLIETSSDFNDEKLARMARQFPDKRFAVKNRSGLFMLPNWIRIDISQGQDVNSFQRIVVEGRKDGHDLLQIDKMSSESVVIFSPGTRAEDLNFYPLFQNGLKEFLALNRGAEFVQLHLPSFRLKETSLSKIGNIFDFVRHRQSYRSEYRALGWETTQWNSEIHAFKPVATYDVIQMYRVN